jgi:hypothetical protein
MNIDIEHIIGLKLSPDEYVFLLLHHKEEYSNYVSRGIQLRVNLNKLQEVGYIKILEDNKIAVRQKFIDLIETDFDRQFAELIGTYPMKVGVAGKSRILHAANPDAKANAKAKDKYRSILKKDPLLHNKIIRLLKVQLAHQRENLQYLNALDVWLNQSMWERWEGIDENAEEDNDERNTRVLD